MSTFEYTLEEAGTIAAPRVVPRSKGRIVVNWITSTDHKTIGYMYLITSFLYFLLAGVMALVIRAQLFEPGLQVVAMDGFTGFKTATSEALPDAVAVMDPFHVVALAGDALERCRQRVQQQTLGEQWRKGRW